MSAGVKNSKQQPQQQQKPQQQPQWNVQVVRGKVTTRCLWNACKALSIGLLLLTVGTTMAVVGYYADQLSERSEIRGNSTVRIRNESRGFHLNNLSYAGPIVMGIGGFIVVAACVMTFEARDSAAKVVPARFKPNLNSSVREGSTKSTPRNSRRVQRSESKRNTCIQTGTGSRSQGLRKMDSSGAATNWSPKNDPNAKRAFTAAFVQFSRELMESSNTMSPGWRRNISEGGLNKSPSAPDLVVDKRRATEEMEDAGGRRMLTKASPKTSNRIQNERLIRPPVDVVSSNLLLRPNYLQRQALSMDNPFFDNYECHSPPCTRLCRQHSGRSGGSRESIEMELGCSAGVSGSQASMALDLHDCQVTLKVKDESVTPRSDTAKRHQLLRQKPVEEEREEKHSRVLSMPRFLCTPSPEECHIRTRSNTNLKTPCQNCARSLSGGRGHIPKITANFRSQSFSQTCSYPENIKCCHCEDYNKIFCIEDHNRRANLSSENIRVCCEEKHRCFKRASPIISPQRNSRSRIIECKVQKQKGSECLIHYKNKDLQESHPLVRNNAKRRKSGQKIEGSLSAEDQNLSKGRKSREGTGRSASFSPTRKISSASSSRNNSCRGSPSSSIRTPSPVTVYEMEPQVKSEETTQEVKTETKTSEEEKQEEVEEPS